ncbi:myelin-oligodendrocyte glycoprotein-like [Amia ocellicauda]|uniref:myelin-oligodendrocyte glycoprotein-like n=1 Tax=Amia ocellicauda TaxID=2972642 RepID=UPI00346421B8
MEPVRHAVVALITVSTGVFVWWQPWKVPYETTVPGHSLELMAQSDSLIVHEGSEAVLPCQLSPTVSAAAMEVWWFRETFTDLACHYRGGRETEGLGYKGRVRLFHQELLRGNVSLLLRDARISDTGLYTCQVTPEPQYSIELQLQLVVRIQMAEGADTSNWIFLITGVILGVKVNDISSRTV